MSETIVLSQEFLKRARWVVDKNRLDVSGDIIDAPPVKSALTRFVAALEKEAAGDHAIDSMAVPSLAKTASLDARNKFFLALADAASADLVQRYSLDKTEVLARNADTYDHLSREIEREGLMLKLQGGVLLEPSV